VRAFAMSGSSRGASNANQGKNILLKVILLGDGGVGKSCLMNRFVSNRFDPTSFHTIGVEFLNKEIQVNGQLYTIQVKHKDIMKLGWNAHMQSKYVFLE
jgi:GTPase SAR1 family protein